MRRGTLLCAALLASACSPDAPPTAAAPTADPAPAPDDDEVAPEDRMSPAGKLALALLEDLAVFERLAGDGPDPFAAASVLRREPEVRAALERMRESSNDGLTQFFAALADPAATDRTFDDAIAAIVAAGGEGDDPAGASAPFVEFLLGHVGRLDDSLYEVEFVGRSVRALRGDPDGRATIGTLLGDADHPRARLVGLCAARSMDPAAFRQAVEAIAAIAAEDPAPGAAVEHVTWTKDAAPSEDDVHLTAAGGLAFSVMERTEAFRGPVGGEGGRTIEGFAMAVLLAEREADAAFKCLAQRSGAAPRLYAACGLRRTDAAAAARLVGELKGRSDAIGTQDGCMVGSSPVAEIADEIARGEYDRTFAAR